jgi:hypothetical protein
MILHIFCAAAKKIKRTENIDFVKPGQSAPEVFTVSLTLSVPKITQKNVLNFIFLCDI